MSWRRPRAYATLARVRRPATGRLNSGVRPHNMCFRKRLSVLIVVVASLCGCFSDVLSSSHPTRAAADETIRHGWIPAAIPLSSTDIRESHNLDTNSGHGTFSFGASDAQSFRASLVPISHDQPSRTKSRKALEMSGYVFYRYEDFDIAVDWKDRKGQFWLGPLQ
jgi:hypothetical protein